MTTFRVDLTSIAGPVYSGRDRGEALREKLEIDSREETADMIDVVIPGSAYTMSSSFFLGLLGPSVRKCGSVDSFERKYRFSAPEFLKPILHGHAELALNSRSLFN